MNKLMVFALGCFMLTAQATEHLPTVDNAWLRAGPPNAKMLAAYATLTNKSDNNIALVGADSEAFAMTEIHRTIEVDGVFKMREQKALPMKAGESLTMEPGGLHIMLMMPKQDIEVGQSVTISLRYEKENGESLIQTINFDVKKSQ
ncbi:MAG: copper chaperone PCu(A)C [Proteobacteria bacterium]|nr:MAG: copper chaperone PCu(A)C [Pseudomonadota bacterium]